MTRAITAALKAHYALGTTHITSCLRAQLLDGTIVTLTKHGEDIVFGGATYLSTAAYKMSDLANAADLSPDNTDLTGFLGAPGITEADVRSGRWDYAKVALFEVNYKDLTMLERTLRSGTLGETTSTRSLITAELRGLTQALSRRFIAKTIPTCTNDLGDAKCGVNLATYTVGGTVSTVTSNRQWTDSSRTEANDWFTGGILEFTSGNNTGLRLEVRRYTAAGVFELHQTMPFDVQVGDTFTVNAGCTYRFTEDCKNKFGNGINFGGFKDMPLSDAFEGPVA